MSVRIASGGKADWAPGSGTVYTNIPELRAWSLRVRNESKQYASSSTNGGKQKIAGAEDFDGELRYYVQGGGTNRQDASAGAGINLRSGQSGTLKLYEDSGAFWLAPAILEEYQIEVGIEDNTIIGASQGFSRNGALVYPTV